MMVEDPVICAINIVICAVRDAFTSESDNPPIGGGSSYVRFFSGDAIPFSAWDMHIADQDCGLCDRPFLWVRLVRRYRSQSFPTVFSGDNPCGAPVAIAIEVGVGRCAVITEGDTAAWQDFEHEAEISLDDSWRIERALCWAATKLRREDCAILTSTDPIVPYGPDSGVIAWVGTINVSGFTGS